MSDAVTNDAVNELLATVATMVLSANDADSTNDAVSADSAVSANDAVSALVAIEAVSVNAAVAANVADSIPPRTIDAVSANDADSTPPKVIDAVSAIEAVLLVSAHDAEPTKDTSAASAPRNVPVTDPVTGVSPKLTSVRSVNYSSIEKGALRNRPQPLTELLIYMVLRFIVLVN